jgi:hypothetical protein
MGVEIFEDEEMTLFQEEEENSSIEDFLDSIILPFNVDSIREKEDGFFFIII